jgi:hypothetical protein
VKLIFTVKPPSFKKQNYLFPSIPWRLQILFLRVARFFCEIETTKGEKDPENQCLGDGKRACPPRTDSQSLISSGKQSRIESTAFCRLPKSSAGANLRV